MPSLIPYRVKELHGSASERVALLSDIRAAGILEAHALDAFLDGLSQALDDADVREREAFEEARHAQLASMSDAELAAVEVKITDAFDRLIARHPALSDELFEACKALIEEVR